MQPPVGELHPLPIPDTPWDMISVDFIVELPESTDHDAVMVVVDSVTKEPTSYLRSLPPLHLELLDSLSSMSGGIMGYLGRLYQTVDRSL